MLAYPLLGVMGVSARRVIKKRLGQAVGQSGLARLAVLAFCFALGALFGVFLSGLSPDDPSLREYLLRYFQSSAVQGGLNIPLWTSIWDLVRWPLFVFLLGGTALGLAGVPALLAARGFLLAYAASMFTRLFGFPGMAASLTAFGVAALVSLPVLFAVSADAFGHALDRMRGARSPEWGGRAQALAPCVGLLVLAVALQRTLMSALFSAVCAKYF